MERKIEGRATIEIVVEENGMISIKQEDPGLQEHHWVQMTHHDVPTVVKMLREAAKEAKGPKKQQK